MKTQNLRRISEESWLQFTIQFKQIIYFQFHWAKIKRKEILRENHVVTMALGIG